MVDVVKDSIWIIICKEWNMQAFIGSEILSWLWSLVPVGRYEIVPQLFVCYFSVSNSSPHFPLSSFSLAPSNASEAQTPPLSIRLPSLLTHPHPPPVQNHGYKFYWPQHRRGEQSSGVTTARTVNHGTPPRNKVLQPQVPVARWALSACLWLAWIDHISDSRNEMISAAKWWRETKSR